MMRRYRTWAMATGLAAALLPGCLSGPSGSRKDATDKPVLPAQGEISGLQGQPMQSPYGQRELATQESTPTHIQQTAAGPTQPAPPPEANFLPPQPQPLQPPPGSSEVASIQQAPVTPPTPPKEDEPLVAALRLYRQQQPARALEQLRKYDPSTRELLALLLPLAARVGDIPLAKERARELAVTLKPLSDLIQGLRSKAALTIENPCFCRIIKTFGEYEPLPEEHAFRYGDPVQVYLELHNLTTRRNGPHHETILTKTVRIYDSQHLPAGKHPPDVLIQLPVQVHQSLIPHRDWYLNCSFYVPPNLPVGTYTLKIDIQDVTELPRGAKVPEERKASRNLTFHVDPRGTGLVFTPTGQSTR